MSAITNLRNCAIILLAAGSACMAARNTTTPDDIVMKDGRILRGLIIKKAPGYVVLQTETEEIKVPSESIRRIDDLPDDGVYFTEVTRQGELPNWRSMVEDLRQEDAVKSFEAIPATTIDVGNLRNVPYLSFRINGASEMNVYGDPRNPAAVEFGVYGKGAGSMKRQRIIREFIAGHLNSRDEVKALYSLDLKKGGTIKCGKLEFSITPPEAEDSYGGRWFCIYNPKRLEKARVSDEAYAKVTKPFNEVNNKDGKLRSKLIEEDQNWLAGTLQTLTGMAPQVRGFYRDKNGTFRLMDFNGGS